MDATARAGSTIYTLHLNRSHLMLLHVLRNRTYNSFSNYNTSRNIQWWFVSHVINFP